MKKDILVEKIQLQAIHDDCLMCVAEYPRQIPFPIKRVYYMVKSAPNLPRGYHTHKKLDQVFFCIQGSMRMILDDGKKKEEIILNQPDIGIRLKPLGYHTHKKLDQVFFCIQGSMRMILDDGKKKEEIILNQPDIGIRLKPLVWHEMHDIKEDTIMLIFASDYYEESDYIRDYKQFIETVNGK